MVLADFIIINLAEIQLYNGINEIKGLGLLATSSSCHPLSSLSNAFDGDSNTIFHTDDKNDQNPWIQINVTNLVITKIIVVNRPTCGVDLGICQRRIVGASISLISKTVNGSSSIIWSNTFGAIQTYPYG